MTIPRSWRPYLAWSFVGLVIVALFWLSIWFANRPDKLDDFAACLKNKGAVFYGAFWCPHCQKQKEAFGRSVRFLPYVECSTPDGNSETEACQEKKIDGFPTWVFADGTRESGELTLDHLAEKTGCVLPKN